MFLRNLMTMIAAAIPLMAMCIITATVYAQESVVVQVKAELDAQGVDLSGPCGAFQVVARVAQRVGSGVLGGKTPAQNGCTVGNDRYSVDFLLWPDGRAVDILIDAGGANIPTWNEEHADPKFYRPVPNMGAPLPDPTPEPPPTDPLTPRVSALEAQVRQLLNVNADLQQQINDTKAKLQAEHEGWMTGDIALREEVERVKVLASRPIPSGCTVQFGLRCSLR